jgi:hypothetical protein
MALRDNNGTQFLSLPPELNKLCDREINWIYRSIHRANIETSPAPIESNRSRDTAIARHLNSQQNRVESVERILGEMKDDLIPEKDFDWIEKTNTRLHYWLLIKLTNMDFHVQHLNNITTADILNEVIYTIDASTYTRFSKANMLYQLKQEWSEITTGKNTTKWIKENDETQLKWSWDYLRKSQRQIKGINPVNLAELYTAILVSFDFFTCNHLAEKTLFIDSMRKSWTQIKYRNSEKAKKQRSLPMSDETKNQLDHIALANDERINETLMRIIQKEFNQTKRRS